jgi:signal transduction histidine kinase
MIEPGATGDASVLSSATQGIHFHHEVQFYFDDRFLIQSLSAFFRSALYVGSSVVVVATKCHRDNLAEELERVGVGFAAAVQQGRYVALDAAETLAAFTVNGVLDKTQFREVIGSVISCSAATACRSDAKVVIFGEMVSLLWQRGEAQSALQLEQLWNQLSASHSFHLRCGYPIASFDREIHTELFSRICAEHQLVIPAEDYTAAPNENDRLRAVARLQHAEQLLKTESEERRIAQDQTLEVQNRYEELVKEIHHREEVEDELRRFTRRLLTARDEEQRVIAAELHENTAQLLAALSLYFGVLHEEKGSLNPRLASIVASSRSVSERLLSEIRKLSHLLHPPTLDDMGLDSALKEYIDQFMASSGAKIALEISGNLGRFDRKLEIAVFRIVEEALANIHPRFGKAFAIVRLRRSAHALMVEVQTPHASPSGKEIPVRAETRITGIQERVAEHGGTVQFISDPLSTLVSVILPVEDAGDQSGPTGSELTQTSQAGKS